MVKFSLKLAGGSKKGQTGGRRGKSAGTTAAAEPANALPGCNGLTKNGATKRIAAESR